jgi:16S rRNA processing protein RimM
VAGPFGVKGEVKITAFTDDPMALVGYRDLLQADGAQALTLLAGRAAKGGLVARAKEAETREQAEALRGLKLYVPRAALPPPADGEFYLADLIGLAARDRSGAAVGSVTAVENFGAGDLLEIAPADGGPTWWLRFTREAVPEVSIVDGWLVVAPPTETEV